MLTYIDTLGDDEYEGLLEPVWRYLVPEETPQKADVVFVFGGLGLEVPARASELYKAGFAPVVVISGSSGPLTRGIFTRPEAQVFKEEMVRLGVPDTVILTEDHAKNTGQNVTLGMQALQSAGKRIETAILVAKSFIMRRCVATFAKQFPAVRVVPCPPRGRITDFVDRPRPDFAERMLAELQRLQDYSGKFIVEQHVPDDVSAAANRIKLALARSRS